MYKIMSALRFLVRVRILVRVRVLVLDTEIDHDHVHVHVHVHVYVARTVTCQRTWERQCCDPNPKLFSNLF